MSNMPPPPPVGPDDVTYAGSPATTYYAPSTGLATTSLVLGLISIPTNCICIGPLLGLTAVVVGIVALSRAAADPYQHGGKGLAIGGIVSGGLSLLLLVVSLVAVASGAVSPGQFMKQGLGVGQVAVDLENVGAAIKAYQDIHSEYPPDLQALVDADLVAENPVPGASDDPVDGMFYVTGLTADDPGHWILAYEPTSVFGVKLTGVLYNSGESDVLEQVEYATQWAQFKQEYEADHGAPPVVLEPDGTLLADGPAPAAAPQSPAPPTPPASVDGE